MTHTPQVPAILFEDEHFLAVLKPAGMIVNKADTAKDVFTLQDFSSEKLDIKNISVTPEKREGFMVGGYNKFDEFISRGGIVHRLDKETSGAILIAKSPTVFIALQEQFKNKTIKKEYITLVHGKVEKKEGIIDAPIARLPWNRMRFGVVDGGRSAITKYKVTSYWTFQNKKEKETLSYVEVYPETGRTHQIRVHFQHINRSIFADELYAGRKTARDDRQILRRHFLHAAKISLLHPVSHERMEIVAPLPEDLEIFLATLEKQNDA